MSFFTVANGIPEQIFFHTLLQLGERSIISVIGLAAAAFLITWCDLTAHNKLFESSGAIICWKCTVQYSTMIMMII